MVSLPSFMFYIGWLVVTKNDIFNHTPYGIWELLCHEMQDKLGQQQTWNYWSFLQRENGNSYQKTLNIKLLKKGWNKKISIRQSSSYDQLKPPCHIRSPAKITQKINYYPPPWKILPIIEIHEIKLGVEDWYEPSSLNPKTNWSSKIKTESQEKKSKAKMIPLQKVYKPDQRNHVIQAPLLP